MVGSGNKVLELGPGPGAITRLLRDAGNRVTAVEVDPEALDIVRRYCDEVVLGDLNELEWSRVLATRPKFDVIVAGDVLEHLYEPLDVLSRLHPLLNDKGAIVASLPHVAHNAVISCLLETDFEYQPWGLLDKTHIRFFGLRNIQTLFDESGFKIVAAEFVTRIPEQTEFASHWRRLSQEQKQLLRTNRFGNVYQVVVRAVPKAAIAKGLRLVDLVTSASAERPCGGLRRKNAIVEWIVSRSSLRTRKRIADILERMAVWR